MSSAVRSGHTGLFASAHAPREVHIKSPQELCSLLNQHRNALRICRNEERDTWTEFAELVPGTKETQDRLLEKMSDPNLLVRFANRVQIPPYTVSMLDFGDSSMRMLTVVAHIRRTDRRSRPSLWQAWKVLNGHHRDIRESRLREHLCFVDIGKVIRAGAEGREEWWSSIVAMGPQKQMDKIAGLPDIVY